MHRKPARPGSLTFVAIVLIILGSLSLLGGLTGAPTLIITAVTPDPPPRQPGEPPNANDIHRMAAKETATYYPVVGGSILVDLLFGIGQIVCGIGLLKMNPSRRIPAILVTLVKMVFSWGNQAYQVVVLGPVTAKFFEEAMKMPAGPQGQPPPPMPFDMGTCMQAGMGIGVAITVIVQLAILLTITLILTSAGTKAAFAAAAAPQVDDGAFEADKDERRRSRYEGYDDEDDLPPKSPPDTGITDRS